MPGILDLIDSAIEDCTVSDDAMRSSPAATARRSSTWTAPVAGRYEVTRGKPLTPEQRELVRAAFAELGRVLAELAGPFIEALGGVAQALPADPAQSALEARRNRNTGPAARPRPPRRIDPRRART